MKSREQLMVEAFHRACELPIGDYGDPQIRSASMRAKLVLEEATEFACALIEGDLAAAADALADLQVVILGSAVEFGLDLGPIFDEVHRTNLLKKDGPRRPSDGKLLKPEGWKPPNVAGIISAQRRKRRET